MGRHQPLHEQFFTGNLTSSKQGIVHIALQYCGRGRCKYRPHSSRLNCDIFDPGKLSLFFLEFASPAGDLFNLDRFKMSKPTDLQVCERARRSHRRADGQNDQKCPRTECGQRVQQPVTPGLGNFEKQDGTAGPLSRFITKGRPRLSLAEDSVC